MREPVNSTCEAEAKGAMKNSRPKKQITINLDKTTIDYFKTLSEENGIPYQVLINLYLRDFVENRRPLRITWQ